MKNNYTLSVNWFRHFVTTLILSALIFNSVFADGYKIVVKFNGIQDTVCYLANYYGDKTYLTDTAYRSKKDEFVFHGDSVLPGGIYILAGQSNNKYLELIVDQDQKFTVSASLNRLPHGVKFKDSPDNRIFFDYINFSIIKRQEVEKLSKRKSVLGNKHDSVALLNAQIKNLLNEIENKENEIITDYPDRFVSTLLKAMQEPKAKPAPILENGNEDSTFIYQSFKRHYWDNLSPKDERLLRTPLYHKRLEDYFSKVIYQHPDSLITEAENFIKKAKPNRETYKYAIWFLTYKFETSKIMGFDEIFVHMVDNYYAKGEAYWADSSVVKSLVERSDELRKVLIGNYAQELILIDTAGTFKSLYSFPANYMIVLFYESDCSHCKKEIKELKDWYLDNSINAKIFAVNTDTSLVKWKKFITEQELNWIHVNGTRSITQDYHFLYDIRTTPTIYLLDNKKKIIAKRLKTDQLFPFLENYEKRLPSESNSELNK